MRCQWAWCELGPNHVPKRTAEDRESTLKPWPALDDLTSTFGLLSWCQAIRDLKVKNIKERGKCRLRNFKIFLVWNADYLQLRRIHKFKFRVAFVEQVSFITCAYLDALLHVRLFPKPLSRRWHGMSVLVEPCLADPLRAGILASCEMRGSWSSG